jgi:hypothetical protein
MLQKMMKAVSLKYTRTKTVTIETTSSKLLDLIRNEPILFLDAIMGIKVEETLKEFKAGDEFGEWTGESSAFLDEIHGLTYLLY